jgi:hypothetical protein
MVLAALVDLVGRAVPCHMLYTADPPNHCIDHPTVLYALDSRLYAIRLRKRSNKLTSNARFVV